MIRKTMTLGGREFSIETGRMAKQSRGSVVVRHGSTIVLVTANANLMQESQKDFFPLQCEYRERSYAAGKIPGGFFKREGRPSEKEILAARLIDRPIRPLFPDGFQHETQIIAYAISSDKETPADVLGMVGASAALSISDIPFMGPIAAVRVGKVGDEYIINPTYEQLDNTVLEIVVSGNEESVVMVEGEAQQISEDVLLEAITFGHKHIVELINFQKELIAEIQPQKYDFQSPEIPAELEEAVRNRAAEKLDEWREKAKVSKKTWENATDVYTKNLIEELEEEYPEKGGMIRQIIDDILKTDMRKNIAESGKRLDGRGLKEIRQIECEVGVLPRAHGSALFTRGETQSLGSTTLGTKYDEQILDDIEREESSKKFMLHYNFPPFCVGEVKPIRGTGRREIGHGNLAERAIKSLLPGEEDFPYTLRVVSDVLESNGSSSMATVCSGSLALMDAGVPLPKTIAGIAMGLIKEGDEVYVLSDILGAEDHWGDMDFKVAGTQDGITAIQMDLKVSGISTEIMRSALEQAREGRLHIIGVMEETMPNARDDISPYAPKMITFRIDTEMIGDVIGPGGKTIRGIQSSTGATIEIADDGLVFISAPDSESGLKAKEIIDQMLAEPEEGAVYNGTVTRLENYGAFVEFIPGKEGLLHISEVAWERTENINDVLKVGDVVDIKLKKISGPGRFELSIKDLKEKPEGYQENRRPPRHKSGGNYSRRPGDKSRPRNRH